MALAQASTSLCLSFHDAFAVGSSRSHKINRLPTSSFVLSRSFSATGSPFLSSRTSYRDRRARNATSLSIRCEQGTQQGNSVDVWLGRLAMVGFAVAITVEISTGKGLLEQNFGLTTPLPTVALAVTALVGVLTAVFIFQSASKS